MRLADLEGAFDLHGVFVDVRVLPDRVFGHAPGRYAPFSELVCEPPSPELDFVHSASFAAFHYSLRQVWKSPDGFWHVTEATQVLMADAGRTLYELIMDVRFSARYQQLVERALLLLNDATTFVTLVMFSSVLVALIPAI